MSETAATPLLSLIVPVYNVAPFLPQCLDSLLAGNLDGFEVLLIDDGATDESPAILAAYAARHPAFHVHRRENGGLSAARNTGLDLARGEYVAFLDSDDFIEPDYFRRLLELAQERDLTIAHGNGTYHFMDGREDHPIFRDGLDDHTRSGRDLLRYRLEHRSLLHMVWMHLYRRDFIEHHQMRFAPRIIHEDVVWTTRAFLLAERTAYLEQHRGIFYRQRGRKPASDALDAIYDRIIDSTIYNAREVAKLADAIDDDPALRDLVRWHVTDGALSLFHAIPRMSRADRRLVQWRKLRREHIFGLLWRNATLAAQKRRIARNYLKASWLDLTGPAS